MTELDAKLVKVDNWGIFFLQRLKHFFNRTDYCDLTLQFQDNAQLKVHRLVLSACTEYFELLERTCEMYEDCLVMPDDLQADVVVPIVNFMYTGQLEFRMDLLERLYQTSQIMNMPVLTKLLDAHRNQPSPKRHINHNNNSKRSYSKPKEKAKSTPAVASSSKRPFSKAFGEPSPTVVKERKISAIQTEVIPTNNGVPSPYQSPTITTLNRTSTIQNQISRREALKDPRPTRYELPEELDTDNIFDNSFTNISYTSQPLMVHPETTKQYQRKKGIFGEGSGIRKLGEASTLDIVECKKVTKKETEIFDEHDNTVMNDDLEMFSMKPQPSPSVTNQLFDQIIDQPKVTIEAKDSIQASNIDHAKIISEVLKKYPHLVKNNKNIKLKILNTPTKGKPKKARSSPLPTYLPPKKEVTVKTETFETDVLDSKEAARLIALGAENVKGPWICLICGTPGRALHFTTYYSFRRHLVEVHNEKPVITMCEYCGLKSLKRNYLLHHLLTKHGVEPPPQYNFPKCNQCSYIALTEGLLVKHKLTHTENRTFRCNICAANYSTSSQLLAHIKKTGHKYFADKKVNLQCVYCNKQFLREFNLYAHLKTNHKLAAKNDGIIDDSDEEMPKEEEENTTTVKIEHQGFDTEYDEVETQYQIRPDGNIEVVTKPVTKQRPVATVPTPTKQKILNAGVDVQLAKPAQREKPQVKNVAPEQTREELHEEIVMIDNNEYVVKNNQLIPKKKGGQTYVLPDMMVPESQDTLPPPTSLTYSDIQGPMVVEDLQKQKMMIKNTSNLNQPIQIVVSNEEEYKALMNSNHSIIFDDGDANKTLTVLSTPHNAAINTLDLENAHSNDMMIIQDNYPMNVSEGLTGDNSNIVVVYSHGVDQNKQFQLISSQDIGAQFVQSSAVLTQNFVTPTSVTPAMAEAQGIESQMAQSWQSNVHNTQTAELTQLTQMETVKPAEIVPMDQTEIISNEDAVITTTTDMDMASSTHIVSVEETELSSMQNTELTSVAHDTQNTDDDLPEVTLTSDISQEATEAAVEHNVVEETDQLPEENNEHVEPEGIANKEVEMSEEAHNADRSMDVDMSIKSVTAQISECAEVSIPNEPSSGQHISEQNEQVLPEQQIEVEENAENNIVEDNVEGEQTDDLDQAPASTEGESHGDSEENDNLHEQDSSNTALPVSDAKIALPEEAKEQIQSLTSEWSEDEYDTEGQEQIDGTPEKAGEQIVSETQVEESIESIQQEMDKQVGEISEAGDTEDSVGENLPEQTVEPPQAKISSLLNDWDENDSQEGNESTNGTEDSVPLETAEAEEVSDVAVLQKIEPKKAVQSLVSDWDDDEEEGKM
ncbi:BTB/POZ domain-containing protein [Phthorimaea operculella]|nr:BTB/POZ domain-containing protein [Phthorimaea operculella]